ncbi:MAG: TVP38/TMEM64 family protein [Bernardetiaceae bacterium]
MLPLWRFLLGLVFLFLVLFGGAVLFEVDIALPYLESIRSGHYSTWDIALILSLLLISDIVLPIPGSILILLLGKFLGVIWGTLIGLLALVTAGILGYGLGRFFPERMILGDTTAERSRAQGVISRWGGWGIFVTRPLPLLSESLSVGAGASRFPFFRYLIFSAGGHLPATLLYAWSGSQGVLGADAWGSWPFLVVLVMSAIFWWVGKYLPLTMAK